MFDSEKLQNALGWAIIKKHHYNSSNPSALAALLGKMMKGLYDAPEEKIPDETLKAIMLLTEKKNIQEENLTKELEKKFPAIKYEAEEEYFDTFFKKADYPPKYAHQKAQEKTEETLKLSIEELVIKDPEDPISGNKYSKEDFENFKLNFNTHIISTYRIYFKNIFNETDEEKLRKDIVIENGNAILNTMKLIYWIRAALEEKDSLDPAIEFFFKDSNHTHNFDAIGLVAENCIIVSEILKEQDLKFQKLEQEEETPTKTPGLRK